MSGILDILTSIGGYFGSLGPLMWAGVAVAFVLKAATTLTRKRDYEWETLQKIAAAQWFYELMAVDWEHYCALCRLVVERQGMRVLGSRPNVLAGVDILAEREGSLVLARFGRSMSETIAPTDVGLAVAAMEHRHATHVILMSPGHIDPRATDFSSDKPVMMCDGDRFADFINKFAGGRLYLGARRDSRSRAEAA